MEIPVYSRPPAIDTVRLRLEVLLPAEIKLLLAGDSQEAGRSVGASFPPGWPIDIEAREGLPWHLRHLESDASHLPWRIRIIVERSSSLVVGSINLKGPPDASGDVEIGWGVSETHQRLGYAFEAASAVINWVAMQHNAKSVSATVPRLNAASRRLAQKLGMSQSEDVRRNLPLWRLGLKQ